MKISSIILTIYLTLLASKKEEMTLLGDPNLSKLVAEQYMGWVESYCADSKSGAYSIGTQIDIAANFSNGQTGHIDGDFPGIIGDSMGIAAYLEIVKKDKIVIKYDDNLETVACYAANKEHKGFKVTKRIYKNGKEVSNTVEIIVMKSIGDDYKIGSVHSLSYRKDAICEKEEGKDINTCKFLDLAESELQANNIELAVGYRQQAVQAGCNDKKRLSQFHQQVSLDSTFKSGYRKGVRLMAQGNYSDALTYFNSIKKSYNGISVSFAKEVNSKIIICEKENAYSTYLETAGYYYDKGFYDKALIEYNNALSLKDTPNATEKKVFCEKKIQEQYFKTIEIEISRAEKLITQYKKFDEGFTILMKYRHSEGIDGFQYFLMAQIAESPSKKLKNEFDLSPRNRCLLVRQLLLNANRLKYKSEGFSIYWNEYLNHKSRSCD